MSARTPRRASFADILEILFDVALQRCKDRCAHASFGSLLHHFPILNREARRMCDDDPSYAPMVFYERAKRTAEWSTTRFFLEGVPNRVHVSGFVGARDGPPEHAAHRSKRAMDSLAGAFHERLRLARMTEACDSDAQLEEYANGHEAASNLPLRVRAFLRLYRGFLNEMRIRQGSMFGQCVNKRCNRLLCVFEEATNGASPGIDREIPELSPFHDGTDCVPSRKYWAQAGIPNGFRQQDVPFGRFCTSACYHEWQRQSSQAIHVPDFRFSIAPSACDAEGAKRIHVELKHALWRNSRFRLLEKRSSPAVSSSAVRGSVCSTVKALNVDVGMLYWASVACRLPTLLRVVNEIELPGATENWRFCEGNVDLVRVLSCIYDTVMPVNTTRVITDTTTPNRFLSFLKTKANHPDLVRAIWSAQPT